LKLNELNVKRVKLFDVEEGIKRQVEVQGTSS
jgi:hypothetical protein